MTGETSPMQKKKRKWETRPEAVSDRKTNAHPVSLTSPVKEPDVEWGFIGHAGRGKRTG